LTPDPTDTTLCSVREYGAICVLPKTNKQTERKFKCQKCKTGVNATQFFKVYHTKLHFLGSTDTIMEKQNTQMSVNITIVITELIFFSRHFLDEILGGEGDMDFTDGSL
jgi:hypothetical protein